jgi:hypothetical protein
MFSFTKAGEPWYAWEWLWDVVFGWLHQQWGMAAVVLGSLLILCVCARMLYGMVRERCGDSLIAIAVTFVALAASSIHWLARPHLFTLLFVLVFYRILERVAAGRTQLIWWLPPLTIIWTNLHGGFFVGIVLIGTYAAGELAAWLFHAGRADRRTSLRRVGLTCWARRLPARQLRESLRLAAARAHHPLSHRPLSLQQHQRISLAEFPPPAAIYFEVLLALGVIAAVQSFRERQYSQGVADCGLGATWRLAARNIPIYRLPGRPWDCRHAEGGSTSWRRRRGWMVAAGGGRLDRLRQ